MGYEVKGSSYTWTVLECIVQIRAQSLKWAFHTSVGLNRSEPDPLNPYTNAHGPPDAKQPPERYAR